MLSEREELQSTIGSLETVTRESDKTLVNWHMLRNRVLQAEYDRLLIELAQRDERIAKQQATITMLKNASR